MWILPILLNYHSYSKFVYGEELGFGCVSRADDCDIAKRYNLGDIRLHTPSTMRDIPIVDYILPDAGCQLLHQQNNNVFSSRI